MTELQGIVEYITFNNPDNNYTVAKLKLKAGKLVTIVGNLPPLYVGEGLLLKGEWTQHKEYGEQFQVSEWESEIPNTLIGIERFLSSGLLKGIGTATAQKIVRKFGQETLDIIQNRPEQLLQIPGFSMKKAERISASLKEHSEIQRIMVFLQGIGISPGYALKIYQKYEQDAIKIVTENPYRLADDVFGIGFKIADQIAKKLGVSNDSPYRVRAVIRYMLNENSNEGHVFTFENTLIEQMVKELEVNEIQIAAEIENQVVKKELFKEKRPDGEYILYLAPYYYSETGVVARLRDLLHTGLDKLNIDAQSLLNEFEAEQNITLAEKQKEAIFKSLENGVLVITGGPGTGKTTIVKAILYLFKKAKCHVKLAAPTGRAAKRLAETTQVEARTIHRLLGYGNEAGQGNRFQYDEDEPLKTDVLIIDEFSMVDLMLFYNLLKAVTDGTRLIVVGDVDQLPSVGPGSVLRDLIQSETIPTVRLNVIFRQAEESLIIANAHKINSGEFPLLSKDRDFFFIEAEDPEIIVQVLPDLVQTRLPNFLGCDPVEDIQVLTPMRRTITGVENLNICLQGALNPPAGDKSEIKVGMNIFRLGDKVMQIRNDYQKMVFNGDIGRIREIDPEDRGLMVGFPDVDGETLVPYEGDELDQLVLSYAISVHKSQGNEYPVVIMPVTTQHYMMLQRNLLYTAVTRAKKMVVLLGTKKAIAIAIHNNKIEERNSLLKERLSKALCSGG